MKTANGPSYPQDDVFHSGFHRWPRFLCFGLLPSGIHHLAPEWDTYRTWSSLRFYVQSEERLLHILLRLQRLDPHLSAPDTLEPSGDRTVPGRIPNCLVPWVSLVHDQRLRIVTREQEDFIITVVDRKPLPAERFTGTAHYA